MTADKRPVYTRAGHLARYRLARSSAIAALLAVICSSAALALPVDKLIEDAAVQYKGGNYGPATLYLQKAISESPHNAEAHYFLANCYVFLKRDAEAVDEYLAAMQWGGTGDITNYSRQALINLGALPAGTTQTQPDNLGRSLNEIGRQADQSAGILQKQAANAARDINQIGTEHAQTVETHGAQRVNDMQNAYSTDKWGNTYPLYSADQISAAQHRYQNRADTLRSQDRASIDNLQRESEQHAALTRQSAADLADQMQQAPSSPGGAKLKPQGTNLYIRNYDTK